MNSRLSDYQNTLDGRIDLSGIGVHSGKPVSISILPADPNSGIVFQRTDVKENDSVDIPATYSSVSATTLCTMLGDPGGVFVATVEHLLAALRSLNVDNAYVEIDSVETPVMDGSSEVFVDAIDQVGLVRQAVRRRYIKVLKPVRVECGGSWGEFTPHDGSRFEIEIDYDAEVIGRQRYDLELTADAFRNEICRARTFGFWKDVESLWAAGFALGSSLENSVVIGDDNTVVNPEGLRYENEFVRHKVLDTIGDLALAGAPIRGCFRSYKGGHKLNALALAALMEDVSAFEIVEGVVHVERANQAESSPISAAAFAPEIS